MNTKEAIKFMSEEINYCTYVAFKHHEGVLEADIFEKKRKSIIKLLERGEELEQTRKNFKKYGLVRK